MEYNNLTFSHSGHLGENKPTRNLSVSKLQVHSNNQPQPLFLSITQQDCNTIPPFSLFTNPRALSLSLRRLDLARVPFSSPIFLNRNPRLQYYSNGYKVME
ncbi:hypothetical protein ACET3Z_003966 [Daucus carota]